MVGNGLDVISYSPTLGHVYAAAGAVSDFFIRLSMRRLAGRPPRRLAA
jgi:hypothetical protein